MNWNQDKLFGMTDASFRSQVDDALCCIETSDGAFLGTGLRIGEDLILTSHHVVASIPNGVASACCRFDYFINKYKEVQPTFTTNFDGPPLAWAETPPADALSSSDPLELDYAVLKLTRDRRLRLATDGGARRWFELPRNPKIVSAGDRIEIYHHPASTLPGRKATCQPQQRSEGVVADFSDDSSRFFHDAPTAGGSSGAPCFDKQGNLIGLHVAGSALGTAVGTAQQLAVPLRLIVAHILEYFPDADDDHSIIGARPPPARRLTTLDPEIRARLEAARILMDRDEAEQAFVFLRFNEKELASPVRPLVHVLAGEQSDRPHWFRDRLMKSTLLLQSPDKLDDFAGELLEKGAPLQAPWLHQPGPWPSPEDEDEARLAQLRQQHITWGQGRRLVALSSDLDAGVDLQRERALVAAFARLCAEEFRYEPESFQCVILFNAPKETAAQVTSFWRQSDPPPYCGLCQKFAPIGQSQLDRWLNGLVKAWGAGEDEIRDSIAKAFSAPSLPIAAVSDALTPKLMDYIHTALLRS